MRIIFYALNSVNSNGRIAVRKPKVTLCLYGGLCTTYQVLLQRTEMYIDLYMIVQSYYIYMYLGVYDNSGNSPFFLMCRFIVLSDLS